MNEHPPTGDHVTAALAGYDPVVRPPVLTGQDVAYVVEDTPLGRMLLAVDRDGAALLARYVSTEADTDRWLRLVAARVSPRMLRAPARTDTLRRELEEYVAGTRRRFDVAVDPVLMGDFQRRVLTLLPGLAGYGHTTTYGALAAHAGAPTAARAVGAALGANPVCVLVPCHRVLAASGALTGYAGGLQAKTRLLSVEGALPG